ncbi:MarR family winged helix-turn-helix transcriptional regulator [Geobacter benzoatilyticus]|uniref:MarR family winged helix-turn-helix transcriptional regulator n=1 Tax=Geobacter benzoatilyticus TaxID=2815309 RepID=UPI001F4C487E|nr:MarR family transcriptional regulator [Geobacter benzoatilyticus]
MQTKVDKNLCYKLQYLARLLITDLNEEMKPYGVTQGQLPVLCCLWEDGGQTQSELCEKIQVEQPTMANTLRRMERDGLIQRTPCDRDKRQFRIHLTEQTRPSVAALQEKRDEVIARMTRKMSPEDQDTLHQLIDRAIDALKNPGTNMESEGRKNEEL